MNSKKRAGWKKFSFEDEAPLKRSNTPKRGSLEPPPIIDLTDYVPGKKFNFEAAVEPKTVNELAVHDKKVEDVKNWLTANVVNAKPKNYGSMLLLTGPVGSGKTTTLKLLCKTLNINVVEWINPLDKEFQLFKRDGSEGVFRGPGQITQLLEFLNEAKYPSLLAMNQPRLILIKDFPNVFISHPQEFTKILDHCFENNKFRVAFICSETSCMDINLAQKLFPAEIQQKYFIANINFNSSSATLLKRALKRAKKIIEENVDDVKVPTDDMMDSIIVSAMGDIRCAVNQYYFSCLKDASRSTTKAPAKYGKRKRTKDAPQLKSMMRDESLNLFHSVGRVLNPKRVEKGDSWRLKADIDALVDSLCIQPNTFNNFLHENYLKYFGDVNDVAGAADVLSLSEIMLNSWSDRKDNLTYSLWLAILGVMVNNNHRVSKWTQINGPRKITKVLKNNEDRLNVEERCYFNIINKTDHYRTFDI